MIKKAATFIVFTMVINVARSDEMEDRISVMLTEVTKGVDVVRIAETPISNIMKVELSNGNFVYVTRDAQFVFPGQLLQHRAGGLVNLTERDLAAKRKVELNSVDLTQTITFKARNEEKSEIYVFTDISCGYCKKFHRQIDEINKAGITVHYLAFPRAGSQSATGEIMSRVWCAKNRQVALTSAKRGREISRYSGSCENQINQQHELGLVLGVKGTPGIYDSEGRHLGGYLTSMQLSEQLD